MRPSVLLGLALGAAVNAAPAYPELNLNAALPDGLDYVSEYFNMLAAKVAAHRFMSVAPVCDLDLAQFPDSSLPPPSKGLTLKHVAIGRGTQNYTCDTTNATSAPVAIGALATLFNATCIAATYPDLLAILPKVALQFDLVQEVDAQMSPSNLAISGHHFFTNTTTPFFNLNTTSMQLGEAPCSKNNTMSAPADAPVGLTGDAAVAWLKLLAENGTTGDLQEIYRLNTAGGSAPATCAGQPASFEVQYAAQYWFFQGPPPATLTTS